MGVRGSETLFLYTDAVTWVVVILGVPGVAAAIEAVRRRQALRRPAGPRSPAEYGALHAALLATPPAASRLR